ncbi:hypothetical protein OROMI_024505 [Orobanche minor]
MVPLLEAGGILTYRKCHRNCSVLHFSSKLDVPSNLVQKKRVARILLFKISPSQEILKIRDGTPLEKKRVARILVFKIRSSQEILKIRDGTPLEMSSQEILKIRDGTPLEMPSQNVLKIRDGTPLEVGGILKYRKGPRNCSVWHFSSKLDVPGNVVQKKRVARILVFKIRSSQEILKIRDPFGGARNFDIQKKTIETARPSQNVLKIRDGTPLEVGGILKYRKGPRNCSVWHFSSKLDVPGNVVQKKRVARILVFKIRSSQEILKIRDPFGGARNFDIQKKTIETARKLDVPSNVVQRERVARILVFKIRSSQEILKIRDGTPLKAEGILTYRKSPRNCSVWHFSSKLDVPSNVVQNKRVACILVFKIRQSQEILKIRDGTPLEAGGILTYRKSHRNCSVLHFSSKLDVPSNLVQKKRVARILLFKIRPSQEILKIVMSDVPSNVGHKKRVARILVFKIRPSKEILKIRDGTPLEAEGILTYKKSPRNCSVWHFSSKLDVPSNVVQRERVARILVFKIRPSKEILKIRDGTPLEAEGILTYRKKPSKLIKILKIRDGTPLEAGGILTYRKSHRNCSVLHFSSKLDVPSNLVQKKRVARILLFKIRPSQEILKIRDGTPLEMPSQEILKIRDGTPLEWPSQGILKIRDVPLWRRKEFWHTEKIPLNCSVWHFYSKLYVPSNVVQKKRVARILVFKIRPSQKILKIRDGTPLEAEGILSYRKSPRNCSVWHFSSKLDVPSNVVQKKRVARILVFKIRSSQEILKIRDGTPLKTEGILTYRKKPSKLLEILKIVMVPFGGGRNFDIQKKPSILLGFGTFLMSSQEILKIRDGTPLKAEGILTYRKIPRNCSVWHFSSKLDVPSNVVQNKRVACILVFKIRQSQEILKIRDGTPFGGGRNFDIQKMPSKLLVARILLFKIRPSQEILKIRDEPSQNVLKIRDGTPLEVGGILTYRKGPRNCSVWHFSSKLDVPGNVVQKKRVARILVFKIRSSQEILKIRDGTPLEAEGILTYRKRPSKLLVARILVFKIRPSKEILKIRDGTPLEAEGILTYKKSPRNCSVWHFSSKLDVPSNVVQRERVARILVFKIRSSQEILKIRDGTPLKAEGILTYRKSPRNCSVWHFSSKLDVPSNVVQNKRVACILVFKIRQSQEILKIRDGTPLEAGGILTYRKSHRNCSVLHFSSKLDVPSNLVQKKRVARILLFKIRPSQEILKIRDGTPLEWPSQGILKIRDVPLWRRKEFWHTEKIPLNCSVWHFSSKLYVPSNVVQKKRVARILVFKIRPSQKILKIRDGTPLEAEGILSYRKSPRNCSVWHFSSKLDVPSNVVQKKRVARILVFKIRSSQEILKIRDGTPLKTEGILTYRKKPSKLLGLALFYKF